MKNYNDTIRNRTRILQACSSVVTFSVSDCQCLLDDDEEETFPLLAYQIPRSNQSSLNL